MRHADFETTVWVDGKKVGITKEAMIPLALILLGHLEIQGTQVIVCVWDPTDKGTQPRGKQVSSPGGIWYTPTTGIWQTVWFEPVNESHIASFRIISNPDDSTITLKPVVTNPGSCNLVYTILKDGKLLPVRVDLSIRRHH